MEVAKAVWISKGLADKGIEVTAYDICMLSDTYDMYREAMREIEQTEYTPLPQCPKCHDITGNCVHYPKRP
jgi:hypothetical protein